MASTTKIMWKLQAALKMYGDIVTISTRQFYSEEQDRFVKMYIVKSGKKVLEQSCSQIKVIDCLVDRLNNARRDADGEDDRYNASGGEDAEKD